MAKIMSHVITTCKPNTEKLECYTNIFILNLFLYFDLITIYIKHMQSGHNDIVLNETS